MDGWIALTLTAICQLTYVHHAARPHWRVAISAHVPVFGCLQAQTVKR